MDETLPDALVADLKDLFLADSPTTTDLPEPSLLLKHETDEPPSPRVVFLSGEARRFTGQDYTARIPFTVELISSEDRMEPDDHRLMAGEIDRWLRDVAIDHRRDLISSRVYLHDLFCGHPSFGAIASDRERVARIKAEAVVTLAETVPA